MRWLLRFIAVAALLALPLVYFGMYAGDAVLHLVFAENAARGAWFTFNPGEVVPGETSTGWMALLAVLHGVVGAKALPLVVKLTTLATWYAALFLTWRLGRRLGLATGWRWAALLAVGLMPGAAYNATIGMENGVFALLVLMLMGAAARGRLLGPEAPSAPVRDLALGLLVGAAFWLRPEAALVGAVWFAGRGAAAVEAGRGRVAVALAALLALGLAGAQLGLHHHFTGYWLPQSAQARLVLSRLDGISLGGAVLSPDFALRLLAYAPLALGGGLAGLLLLAWPRERLAGPLGDEPAQRVLGFGLALFGLGFAFFTSALGGGHLARYTIYLWPGLALAAAAGGQALWAMQPQHRPKLRLGFALAAIMLLGVYGYEASLRLKLGQHDALVQWMHAPAKRKQATDDLLAKLGNPRDYPVVVAYESVHLRYAFDDRVVVRSLDGRTDPRLLRYVQDDRVDHLGYLRTRNVLGVMQLVNYNRDPDAWALTELRDLPLGEWMVVEDFRFTRTAPDALRIHRLNLDETVRESLIKRSRLEY